MEINELKKRPDTEHNKTLNNAFNQFDKLLSELKKKEIPDEIIIHINNGIDQINSISNTEKGLRRQIKKTQSYILKLMEKNLKIVTKNHYRNTWLALGMTAFGLPLGAAFSISIGNMALLGIGLPIGMVIGMAMGAGMDKKAYENGKQLNVEIKY